MNLLRKRSLVSIVLSVVFSVIFVAVAASAATTISTNINTGGTLTVSGLSNFTGAIYASSTVSLDGAVVINDNSTGGTNDFRVESNGNVAMLLVDASADRLGVGTSTPVAMLSIGTDTVNSVDGDVYMTGGLTLGATTSINSQEGTILFSNQWTGDPTGDEGMVYYSATNKVLRMYDGAAWFTVGTSTSGISTSGTRIQMANLTTDHMTFGTTSVGVAGGSRVLTLTATTGASVPLTIFGTQGVQTGDLLNVFDEIEAEVFTLDYDGRVTTDFVVNGFATTTAASGNIATEGTLAVGVDASGTDATFYSDVAGETLLWDASANALDFDGMATVTVTTGNIATEGTLVVGGDVSGTAIDRIFAGVCYLNIVAVTASSTAYAECTGATGVTAGDSVFVNATTSLVKSLFIQSASSSAVAGDISVLIYNGGWDDGTATLTSETSNDSGTGASLNYWVFR